MQSFLILISTSASGVQVSKIVHTGSPSEIKQKLKDQDFLTSSLEGAVDPILAVVTDKQQFHVRPKTSYTCVPIEKHADEAPPSESVNPDDEKTTPGKTAAADE